MSTKKRVVSAVLAAAVGVSLLCGFGVAKKDYVYQQFETAEPVTSVTVKDASAKVTIRAADTDHITVRYAALPDEEPLYDISTAGWWSRYWMTLTWIRRMMMAPPWCESKWMATASTRSLTGS